MFPQPFRVAGIITREKNESFAEEAFAQEANFTEIFIHSELDSKATLAQITSLVKNIDQNIMDSIRIDDKLISLDSNSRNGVDRFQDFVRNSNFVEAHNDFIQLLKEQHLTINSFEKKVPLCTQMHLENEETRTVRETIDMDTLNIPNGIIRNQRLSIRHIALSIIERKNRLAYQPVLDAHQILQDKVIADALIREGFLNNNALLGHSLIFYNEVDTCIKMEGKLKKLREENLIQNTLLLDRHDEARRLFIEKSFKLQKAVDAIFDYRLNCTELFKQYPQNSLVGRQVDLSSSSVFCNCGGAGINDLGDVCSSCSLPKNEVDR